MSIYAKHAANRAGCGAGRDLKRMYGTDSFPSRTEMHSDDKGTSRSTSCMNLAWLSGGSGGVGGASRRLRYGPTTRVECVRGPVAGNGPARTTSTTYAEVESSTRPSAESSHRLRTNCREIGSECRAGLQPRRAGLKGRLRSLECGRVSGRPRASHQLSLTCP